MVKSIPGFILALIGGIILIANGSMYLLVGIFGFTFGALTEIIATTILIVFGIFFAICGVLTLLGGLWMRKAQTCKKGGLFALIFGILGGFSIIGVVGAILAIIGGILGLVAAGK